MSVSVLAWKPRLPREKCVHFRFRLQGGHDFQAVALDASGNRAAFEKHYGEPLSKVESGYYETFAGIFEISNVTKPQPAVDRPKVLLVGYTSVALGAPALTEHEFNYVMQKKSALRERHKQLQTMNDRGAKSVITLYTLMLLYAAAPFSSLHGVLTIGFSRVWGLGGLWLALTSWFYCDRTLWKYGNHIFEQIFCMRQLFQMDKIAIGRSRLHNLYAILPSYGYSWDRPTSEITPSDDPTRLSDKRIEAAAWFFKLVNFFPLMHFFLFLSMLLFPDKMMDVSGEDRLETYLRVALGFSFVFFLWLVRSMRSCGDLMHAAFRAKRIGVESPWPKFPDKHVFDKKTMQLHKWRNRVWIVAATLISVVNLALFVAWALPQVRTIAPYVPHWLIKFATLDRWPLLRAGTTMVIFFLWLFFKERVIRGVLKAANDVWPSPEETTKRGRELHPILSFLQFLGPVGKFIRLIGWTLLG